MSKYTTELRFICENYAGLRESEGYDNIEKIIENSWQKIFNNFPIFDETYREGLCKKIIMHYYTREIGEETVGLWKLRLATRMNEIMPYYNQLYESETQKFNVFEDVNLTTTHELNKNENENQTINGTETDTFDHEETSTYSRKDNAVINVQNAGTQKSMTTNKKNEQNRYSDTPQGAITGLLSNNYLTNARVVDNNDSASGEDNYSNDTKTDDNRNITDNTTNTITNTNNKNNTNQIEKIGNKKDTYNENIKGKTGGKSYSEMLSEFRETLLNIDMQVISELDNLFMQIW